MLNKLLILFFTLPLIFCFNLDVRFNKLFHSDQINDYFGFSVALYAKNSNSWVFVGAPRGNTTHGITGTTYKCTLDQQCEQFTELYSNINADFNNNFTLNSMHGFAMDSTGEEFIVCGPRAGTTEFSNNNNIYSIKGECYKLSSDNNIRKLQPLSNKKNQIRQFGLKQVVYYMFGEAGFSISINKDDSSIIMGAPNLKSSTGSVAVEQKGETVVMTNRLEPDNLFDYDIYFGYSVTSGKFIGTETFYASGAPRPNEVFVYSIKNIQGKNEKVGIPTNSRHSPFKGKQSSEYFGASLASCNINGDDYDDLIIGAPLFTKDEFKNTAGGDEGKIYIYHGGLHSLVEPKNKKQGYIEGYVKNGQFGTSIACLGDLDQDGFEDIAVSAPYEDGGVVYIFNGGSDGIITEPSQIITGKSISTELRGFGYSISRGIDIDGNKYPDVAIGAYRSGHAVLLRSRPVVELFVEFRGSNELARNFKSFNITICSKYTGKHLPQKLAVKELVKTSNHENRIEIAPYIANTTRELIAGSDNCRTETLLIKNGVTVFDAISITVDIFVAKDHTRTEREFNNVQDFFCADCPMVRKGIHTFPRSFYFVQNCANNECFSDLTLTLNFESNEEGAFILGSSTNLKLIVSLKNDENSDPAYVSKIIIESPLKYLVIPPECQIENSKNNKSHIIECFAGNPLQSGATKNFTILLNADEISYETKSIEVKGIGKTSSKLKNEQSNVETSSVINIESVAEISVIGSTSVESIHFNTVSNVDDGNHTDIKYTFIYQIDKTLVSISPIHEVNVTILYPTKDKNSKYTIFSIESLTISAGDNWKLTADYSIEKEIDHDILNIKTSNTNHLANRTHFINCAKKQWKCEKLTYSISPFPIGTVTLELNMKANVTELGKIMGKKDIVIYDTIINVVISKPNKPNIHSEFVPSSKVVPFVFYGTIPPAKVDTWILALAAIGGFLLLLLLSSALVKAGFFKRKDKEALVQLKRQTQMEYAAWRASQFPNSPLNVPTFVIDSDDD